jgi:hypothetical protein
VSTGFKFALFLLCIIVLLPLAMTIWGDRKGDKSSQATSADVTPAIAHYDKSADAQEKRRASIQKMQELGAIGAVRCEGNEASAVVGPSFHELDFRDKQVFVFVVFSWCFENSGDENVLSLSDSKTNKYVGMMRARYGLILN